MIKVTVYTPSFNYAAFIAQAIDSVRAQSMNAWELIVIDDGSTDNTLEVLEPYRSDPRIRVISQVNKGLNVTNNIALRLARGQYVMRLDADDHLDENALLVLANILDTKPEVGLVYPDYFTIDREGAILDLVRRKKIDEEVTLLDLPAHGACTMFRRDVLMQLGGYLEDYSCQDGHDIWLRFLRHFRPYNVNVPLFYYRQHDVSLTAKKKRILDTHRQIRHDFVERELNGERPRVLGLIPIDHRSPYPKADPMVPLAGRPLIDYTLGQARLATTLDRIVVSTRHREALRHLRGDHTITVLERPENGATRSADVARQVLDELREREGYEPDAVCLLYINTPLRQAHHIDWAVDTMGIFGTESVIAVQEELANCFQHRETGLAPLASVPGMRLERDAIYKENGAIFLTRSEVIRQGRLVGDTVGHVLMLPEESVKINTEYEYWLAEKIVTDWPSAAPQRLPQPRIVAGREP